MPSLNTAQFIGHLGKDPEMRYFESGASVTYFSIATSRAWQKDGEWQEETTWVPCRAWGQVGERIAERFRKGRLVYVEGRLAVDKWNDKQTGEPRSTFYINVARAFALDKADAATAEGQVARSEGQGPPARSNAGGLDEPNDLDGLPF